MDTIYMNLKAIHLREMNKERNKFGHFIFII